MWPFKQKEKRAKYPKCVPIAKARMSDVQRARAGAVRRKRAVANTGPKPSRAATFTKRKKASTGGAQYTGPAIKSDYAGTMLSNKSYEKYYKGMID